MFRYVSCIPALSKTSIMKGFCILSKALSATNVMILFIFFQFVYVVEYIDRFSHVEPSLHLWDAADLSKMDDLFDVFFNSVCQYFIEYFSINVHE